MGKKHKHAEHENLERWLISYADFITLLFALFVVLYALAQTDISKLKEASESIKQAFNPAQSIMENPGGVMQGTPEASILKDSGNSILDKVSPKAPTQGDGSGQGSLDPVTDAVESVNKQIQQMNQGQGSGGQAQADVEVKVQERGVVISFASTLFFEPGASGLKPSSYALLDRICKTLKNDNRIVHVEGHTDSQGISNAVYPSNWELSTSRASSVVRYMISKHGMSPSRLAAVGYADTRPLASNATPAGREKNRRVDLVILFSDAVPEADAGVAQKTETVIPAAPVSVAEEDEGLGEVGRKKVRSAATSSTSKKVETVIDEESSGNAPPLPTIGPKPVDFGPKAKSAH